MDFSLITLQITFTAILYVTMQLIKPAETLPIAPASLGNDTNTLLVEIVWGQPKKKPSDAWVGPAIRHNARVAGGLVLIVMPEVGANFAIRTCTAWKREVESQGLGSPSMSVRLLLSDAPAMAAAESRAVLSKEGGITLLCMVNNFASFDKIYRVHNSFNKREKIVPCITRFFAVDEYCSLLKHVPRIQILDTDALLMKPDVYGGTAAATGGAAFGSLTTSFTASYMWQADCSVFRDFRDFVTRLYTGPRENLVAAIRRESDNYAPRLANGTVDFVHGVDSRFGRHHIEKRMPSHFQWREFSDMHIYAAFLGRDASCVVCDNHLQGKPHHLARCQQACAKDMLHTRSVKVVGEAKLLRYSKGIRQRSFPGKINPCDMEADVKQTATVVHFQGQCKAKIMAFISAFQYNTTLLPAAA